MSKLTPTEERIDVIDTALLGGDLRIRIVSDFGIDPVTITFGRSKYSVYKSGKIFSHNKNKFCTLHDNGKGYLLVNMYDGDSKSCYRQYIHRLVAICFIDNPYNLTDVNHIDFNKSNNDITNLEWSSRYDNMKHAHDGGRFKEKRHKESIEREAWIGTVIGNRKVLSVLDMQAKAGNFYVQVECLLCGNTDITMAQNDFKKNKSKCCIKCRYNKAP